MVNPGYLEKVQLVRTMTSWQRVRRATTSRRSKPHETTWCFKGRWNLEQKAKPRTKGEAARFSSIEFFHRLAIALNRRRHERLQRMDNNGRHRPSATMIEVARFKTPSWPIVCQTKSMRSR
jgi:hypothetical protein